MHRHDTCSRRPVLGLAALALLLAACGGETPTPPPPSAEVWRGEGALVEVTVSDLHCEGCQRTAEKTLAELAGVAAVKADHETDVIRVTLVDPATRVASIARIRSRIHDQNWKVVGEDEVPAED